MGRLKKIVDYVASKSVFKDLALARMTMLVKDDVAKVSDATPDSPDKETAYVNAAKEILGVTEIPV